MICITSYAFTYVCFSLTSTLWVLSFCFIYNFPYISFASFILLWCVNYIRLLFSFLTSFIFCFVFSSVFLTACLFVRFVSFPSYRDNFRFIYLLKFPIFYLFFYQFPQLFLFICIYLKSHQVILRTLDNKKVILLKLHEIKLGMPSLPTNPFYKTCLQNIPLLQCIFN